MGQRTRVHSLMRRPLPRWLPRRVCRLAVAPMLKADLTRLAGRVPSTE